MNFLSRPFRLFWVPRVAFRNLENEPWESVHGIGSSIAAVEGGPPEGGGIPVTLNGLRGLLLVGCVNPSLYIGVI